MSDKTVGFIGVGLMGEGIARNILKGGYPLIVMAHRNRAPIDALVAEGAGEAASPRELAEKCDIIHICVSGSPQVEGVIRGPDGILASGKSGLIIVDCSTSDPVSTQALEIELAAAGMSLVDAPLGRTPKEAAAGTLDAMVGASPEDFEIVRPIIECWAGVIVHLGPTGLGHTMKLINNFIAMGYGALYSEALAIARKSGLTTAQVDSVIAPGRLANGFYETFMKYALHRDENANQFAVYNAHKDMRYLANIGTSVGAVNPIQSAVRNSYAAMEAAGQGERYLPMLSDFIAQANGLPPTDE